MQTFKIGPNPDPVNECLKVLVFATDRLRLYSKMMKKIPTERHNFCIYFCICLIVIVCYCVQPRLKEKSHSEILLQCIARQFPCCDYNLNQRRIQNVIYGWA